MTKFFLAILALLAAFAAYNGIQTGDTFLALGGAVLSLAFFIGLTI